MIDIVQVFRRFDEKRILDDFSVTLPGGEVTCLLGQSGCGKTTLLRIAAGLLQPDAGEVRRPDPFCASFVFQEDRLLPWFSALENLTRIGVDEDAARDVLSRVGLGDDLHTRPSDLSGGMRRRLAIARALAFAADFFFLDEPLRGLDMVTAAPVQAALLGAMRGKAGLLITHSLEEALALGDTLLYVEGPPLRVHRQARAEDFSDTEELKRWLLESSPSSATPTSWNS